MKELADNNFEFDENGGKFSETVENTVGKGKIVCYEQLLPFPQSFKKTCKVLDCRHVKQGLVWKS